jgi:hypothetical protein
MTRIQVDTQRLEDLSRDLGLLCDEFEGIGERVDDYQPVIGRSGRLMDALDDVATNWSDRRGDLIEALRGLAQMATEAARHYERQDQMMAARMEGTSE